MRNFVAVFVLVCAFGILLLLAVGTIAGSVGLVLKSAPVLVRAL